MRIAVVLGAAGAIAAAESDIEERGIRYIAPGKTLPDVRKAPDAGAEVVANAVPGSRVRYVRKRLTGGQASWYLLSTPGLPDGWIDAASLVERLPSPPAVKRWRVDERDQVLFEGTAALTSAGRGLDDRAVQYAERKAAATQGDPRAALARATAQFRTAFWFVSRIMRDVPHDGETPDATGKVHPSGKINETKTADGRVRASEEWREGLE